MFNLIKILAILFVLLGLGIAVIRATPEDGAAGSGGSSFTLFDDLTEGRETKPPKQSGPSGIVIEHQDGGLLVVPWDDGGPILVGATDEERARCPLDARYPDCL